MKNGTKPYLKPQIVFFASPWASSICAGSGYTKFLNEDGTQGFMNSTIEQNGDASEAATRRFDDEEYEE